MPSENTEPKHGYKAGKGHFEPKDPKNRLQPPYPRSLHLDQTQSSARKHPETSANPLAQEPPAKSGSFTSVDRAWGRTSGAPASGGTTSGETNHSTQGSESPMSRWERESLKSGHWNAIESVRTRSIPSSQPARSAPAPSDKDSFRRTKDTSEGGK